MKSKVIRVEYHECGHEVRIVFIRKIDVELIYRYYARTRKEMERAERCKRVIAECAINSALFAGIVYAFEED